MEIERLNMKLLTENGMIKENKKEIFHIIHTVYQEINWLCSLLCGGDGETIEGDGFGKVSQWIWLDLA